MAVKTEIETIKLILWHFVLCRIHNTVIWLENAKINKNAFMRFDDYSNEMYLRYLDKSISRNLGGWRVSVTVYVIKSSRNLQASWNHLGKEHFNMTCSYAINSESGRYGKFCRSTFLVFRKCGVGLFKMWLFEKWSRSWPQNFDGYMWKN